jgi:hypothetical protein
MKSERQIEATELKDEDLEAASGGVFRFIRAVFYPGINNHDETSKNNQAWVTTAT